MHRTGANVLPEGLDYDRWLAREARQDVYAFKPDYVKW
jgi:hypothetical protein